jgi:ribonucleoside-diphosphate reductase beta chain
MSAATPNSKLCGKSTDRFVLFPIKYPDLWKAYKTQHACMWSVEEGDLSVDLGDWEKTLTDDERYFLKHILGFFATADGIINENITTNFAQEITIPEARFALGFQAMMENIHAETYGLFLTTLVTDSVEREGLFNAIKTVPAIRAKAEWAMKWMDAGAASLAERLVAFACVEGISFQGSFCAIFWLKKRGLMPGLTYFNELISRDEGLHMQFGAQLYSMVDEPLPVDRVHAIIREAVQCELEFITEAFPAALVGLNADTMGQFIRATANVVCFYLKVPELYPGVVNPYDWMTLMDVDGKTNYFERRVSEYAKATSAFVTSTSAFAGESDF